MLGIAPEKLLYIVEKAREFDGAVPADGTNSGSNTADDDEREILLDTPDNPTRLELRAAIDQLNIDEQEELLALVWVGRGDYASNEWRAALNQARLSRTGSETDYLVGTPLLADYIEEGLSVLGIPLEES